MINAIIFDFGDVFLNLDFKLFESEMKKIGIQEWTKDLEELSIQFEIGNIDELTFISEIQKKCSTSDLVAVRTAWNSLIGDFPLERLEFLQIISEKYRIFLLSNTNSTHIEKFEHKAGLSFARDFYSCFEKIYFSYEFQKRKPEEATFKFLINAHNLIPKKTLFVDDKLENIVAAQKIGLQTWHLNPKTEDVTQLLDILKTLNE